MEHPDLLNQTAQIVASHVSNNTVPPDQIPSLIRNIYLTLTELRRSMNGTSLPATSMASSNMPNMVLDEPLEPPTNPAIAIRQSVRPDHIVCLEDGKHFAMLKRHIKTSHGMTPEQYRNRWGLPPDYPMVAPNYAQTRSVLAKRSGLGLRHDYEEETEAEPVIQSAAPPQPSTQVQLIPEGVSSLKRTKRPYHRRVAA